MSDQDSDSGEKEFEATEQRLIQARREGNIPQSKETNGLASIVGIIGIAVLMNAFLGEALFTRFASLYYHADGFAQDAFSNQGQKTNTWIQNIALHILPIFGLMVAVMGVTLVITKSVAVSFKKVKPDMKKISPVENIKKKYGSSGLIEFAKDTAKMLFAGLIAVTFLYQFARDYYASSALQVGQIYGFTFRQILSLVLAFAAFQFVLAAIDFPVQRRLHANKLKMTREEMKKETKQSEGDPHVKQSRRQAASKISRGQMLQNVKTSTVIIVNPEHYAVALKWDPSSDKAPICVAKGVDHLAAKIREVATASGVSIYRDPPSARSLYALVDIDQEIHPEHFAAVAAAIQFVNQVVLKTP